MKKLVKFFMLFSFVFVLTNCSKDDDNNGNLVYFFNEPAVIESLNPDPVIRSSHDRFFVPSLENTSLKTGDILWTSFIVDRDKRISSEPAHYEATDFKYIKVDSSKVIMPVNTAEFESYLSDDYKAFIYEAVLYPDVLNNMLFFGFTREKPSNDASFDYEIIWNPEKEQKNTHPTFYIRSKKINVAPEHSGSRETIFAFDMTEFIDYYKKNVSDKNPLYFNLKYKIGTDEDGKDVYREFKKNPIGWNLEK